MVVGRRDRDRGRCAGRRSRWRRATQTATRSRSASSPRPAHGTVGLQGSRATYFPDAGFTGADGFTFAAWDGSTDSNLASVSISVGTGGGGGGGCTYSLAPTALTVAAAGGAGSLALTADSGCGWVAQSSAPWLRVDSASSGSGGGTVRFSVAGNPQTSGRMAQISIGGQTFALSQSPGAAPGCALAPLANCRQSVSARAGALALDSGAKSAAKRSLAWSWKKGEATSLADFGTPAGHDAYALCVYDESGAEAALLFAAIAPAGGSCGSKPCWVAGKNKVVYKDPAATPDGVAALKLRAGARGKASIAAAGKGPSLGLPFLPLPLPLRVQLQSETAACFEATFSTSSLNNARAFRAKPN